MTHTEPGLAPMTSAIPPWRAPARQQRILGRPLGHRCSRLIYNWLPGGMAWLKGLIFGLLIVVVSNWTLLPLIRPDVFSLSATKPCSRWLESDAHVGSWLPSSAASGSGSASSTA